MLVTSINNTLKSRVISEDRVSNFTKLLVEKVGCLWVCGLDIFFVAF